MSARQTALRASRWRWAAIVATIGVLLVGAAPAQAAPVSPVRQVTPDNASQYRALQLYVRSVYLDLFGREPDAAGEATWMDRLWNRGQWEGVVAQGITSSEEFRSGMITDAYDEYLGRGPDAAGLRFWLDKMAHGWTIEQIGSGFIASDEYYAQSGSTPAGWVEALYADVLGRDAAPAEIDFWVGQQAKGMSRPAVAMGFLLSTEHLSAVVDGYYQYLLGRGLDPTGQATSVGRIQAGGRDEAIIADILSSIEYWLIAQQLQYA